ncbi:hypothetical protein ABPG74_013911 [Tetrahymena malaccensis]
MSTSNLRLKPWFHWTDEERSHAIYNAYQKRILRSEDLPSFLRANRINNVSTWVFPLIALPLFNQSIFKLRFAQRILLTKPALEWNCFKIATVAASWLAWLNFSPFYSKLETEKEYLLDTLEARIGINVLDLNDALPRWTTSQEYNRRTQQLYNQRNGFFVGLLYPQEESSRPLVDIATFPKNNFNKDKLTK